MTTENMKEPTGIISGTFVTETIGPTRVENLTPVQYRLANRNGMLFLQGAYHWSEGFSSQGYEWRDIPAVDLGGK